MPFESIIITGPSCAGKTTIAQKLSEVFREDNQRFEVVRAVTTRERREDDSNYEYLDDDTFESLLSKEKLLISSSYRNKKYGIRKTEYEKIIERKCIPVLVITASSACELLDGTGQEKFMSFFLDAPNDILYDRWLERRKGSSNKMEEQAFRKQNETDRTFQSEAHYVISNTDVNATVSLITMLWDRKDQGGALSKKIIKSMIDCGVLLKNTDPEMIKGASYDLRLGDEYYYGGEVRKLSDTKPFLTIEPYDYAIVSCKETAWLPRDVIAKFGLTVGLFCQGIILSNGPQIDPGFHGTLFCLLFNTSNRPVHLKRGKHYATIEFVKTIGYADPYKGKYQEKESIIEYIPANALHGAINELKKEVEQLKQENRTMQNIYLGVVALMFAIISILLVL